ncbi:hypothetical protein [Maribacter sp. 2307ULW6-5]|uniref:hypothetical protein n=1 Tax=Maribacter sp. 2307ULW6-5 TaxID=3386275 RepID=UPI0039BC2C23
MRIAPNIKDYSLKEGKKFKRSLPTRNMFIFPDPKPANEFYKFVNIKFNLKHQKVHDDVPFRLNGKTYFFSFYEVNIPDKTVNLVPLAVDAALANANLPTLLESTYETRKGNWYVAIEVYHDGEYDSLAPEAPDREALTAYFRELKNAYLETDYYHEALFKN